MVKRYEGGELMHAIPGPDGRFVYTAKGVVSRTLNRGDAADATYKLSDNNSGTVAARVASGIALNGAAAGQPVPLILFAPPSITRSVALEALERAGRTWRIVCTSGSLSGLRAAALAGLGVTLHAQGLIPDGLSEVPGTARLPPAGDVEFVVQTARVGMRGPAAELAEAILTNGDRLQRW